MPPNELLQNVSFEIELMPFNKENINVPVTSKH